MPRMKHLALMLVLALEALPAAAAPKATHPLASPVTTLRMDGGQYAGQLYYQSLPADVREKLDKKGQVLLADDKSTAGSFGGYIRVVALFSLPKRRVWDLVTQPSLQILFMPHLVSSAIVSRTPEGETTDFVVKVLWVSVKLRVAHKFYADQSRLEWALDNSVKNDIKAQEGYWQFFELGPDKTIGEYGTRVETGLAVPHFIQETLARHDIPGALTAFRNYVNSNGTWRRE